MRGLRSEHTASCSMEFPSIKVAVNFADLTTILDGSKLFGIRIGPCTPVCRGVIQIFTKQGNGHRQLPSAEAGSFEDFSRVGRVAPNFRSGNLITRSE